MRKPALKALVAIVMTLPCLAVAGPSAFEVYGGVTMADGKRCAVEVERYGKDAKVVNIRTFIRMAPSSFADAPYQIEIGAWRRDSQPRPNNDLIRVLCQRLKEDIQADGRWIE